MEDSRSALSTGSTVVQHQVPKRVPNILNCHICLSPPRNPVVTSCGHLYCWPCVRSLLQRPCPLCHTSFTIIPIYGVDSSEDPAGNIHIPPRPDTTPPPVSPPTLPTAREIQDAFAVLEMVNERLLHEKTEALQANKDLCKTLFSLLRELRTRVVSLDHGEEMSRRREENVVRKSVTAVFEAMRGIRDNLKEMRDVSRRFEKMLRLVTRVGGVAGVWWEQRNSLTRPGVESIAAMEFSNCRASGLSFN